MACVVSLPTHEDQLQDPEYRNWDKACLGLYYLKEGLQSYVDNAIRSLQNTFLSQICQHEGIEEANCTSCTTANVLTCPTYGVCNLRKRGRCSYHERGNTLKEHKSCPNKVCQSMCGKIASMHHFQPSWKNTDARKWCTTHWEIAKCFLPATGYEAKSSAAETDCSGLLNIAINCVSIRNDFQMNMDIFLEIIKVRNGVVHSATLKLTNDELEGYIDMMIKLLENVALKTYIEVKESIGKLKQLKDCKFSISTKDEEDIRKEAVQEAEQEKRDDYLGRKKELQTGLCSIYEDHFKTVPISPPLDELTENVDDVFVKLVIREDLMHGPNKTQLTGMGKKVENLIDIFSNHRNDKICKNMFVVGNAGMGKTTWCMKLLSTWVSAHNKLRDPNKGAGILTKDETMMLEFDVVLFVSLRHALSKNKIRDMIKDQLFSNRPNLDPLTSEVLEKEPEKCIVIVDGLDEWNPPENPEIISQLQHPGLPNKTNLYDCPCLTTTRPWKLEELRLPTNEIDLAVTIEGLDDKKLLAEKVIQLRLKGVDDEMAKERTIDNFTTCLEALSFMQYTTVWNALHFISIPLILVFIVSLWFEEGKLESTWAGTFCGFLECLILKAEGNKRRGRNGRLQQVYGIEALREEWEKDSKFLPKLLHGTIIKNYSKLFLKLGSIAFKSLLALEMNEHLIFTDQTLKKLFSDKELEIAVKIGILSQSKVVGKTLKPMSSLSFLHKTIQEYFAALYICSAVPEKNDILQKFKQFCSNQICIKKMENVVVFVYGLDPKTANMLSHHIAYIQLEQCSIVDVSLALKCCHELENLQKTIEFDSNLTYTYGAIIENGNDLKMNNLHWPYLTNVNLNLNYEPKNQNVHEPNAIESRPIKDVGNVSNWTRSMLTEHMDGNCKSYRCLKTKNTFSSQKQIDLSQVKQLQEVSFQNIHACKVLLNTSNIRNISLNGTSNCTFIIQQNNSLHVKPQISNAQITTIACLNVKECALQMMPSRKKTVLECETCDSFSIYLQVNKTNDQDEIIKTVDKSDTKASELQSTHINRIEFKDCRSCELTIKEINKSPVLEKTKSREKLKTESKRDMYISNWWVDRIKFIECKSCKLLVDLSENRVNSVNSCDTAGKPSQSFNKTTKLNTNKINTVTMINCEKCEVNIDNNKPNDDYGDIDAGTAGISDECIICNLEFSNSASCELKLRKRSTSKAPKESEQKRFDPSLAVDFIQIYEDYCTTDGTVKRLAFSVINGQSKTRNEVRAEVSTGFKQVYNTSKSKQLSIKPLEHLRELTLGNVSKEVPLEQILQYLHRLEKLQLSSVIQNDIIFETNTHLQMKSNSHIEAFMIHAVRPLLNLKDLKLIGLTSDAYSAAAEVLPSMLLIEILVISNGYITVPECIVDSIQALKRIKCLTLHGRDIENAQKLVTEFSLMTQTETLDLSSTDNEILNIYTFSNGHLIPFKNNLIWGKTKEQAGRLAKHKMTDIKKYSMSIKLAEISTLATPALQYLVNLQHLTLEISGDAHLEFKVLAESYPSMKTMHTFKLFARDKDIPKYVNKYISYFNNLKHLTLEGKSITHSENLVMILNSPMSQLETLNLSARDTDMSKYFIRSLENLTFLKHLSLEGRQIQNIEILVISLPSKFKLESLCLTEQAIGMLSIADQEHSIQHVGVSDQSGSIEPKLKKLKLAMVGNKATLKKLKVAIRNTDIPEYVVESIRNHVNLEHLILKGRQIQNVERLANFLLDMKQLETLKLSSRDTDIPRSVVEFIGKLTNIKHLTLKGRQIQNVQLLALSRLTQLETLKLSSRDTDIQGSVVESIENLNTMKHLTLKGRHIQSDECLAHFLSDMTQLETLKLSTRDTDIPGSVVASISKLHNLKHLTLEGRNIQRDNYLHFWLPLQLETLKLISRDNCFLSSQCEPMNIIYLVTDMSEFIVEYMRRLYKLKHFTLEGRQIQNIELLDDILPAWKQLETLKLSSRDTDIPESVITCVKNKTHLKILKYEGRSLECARV